MKEHEADPSRQQFGKIAQGICPCGAFISRNLGKIFIFGAHSLPLHRFGEIWRGGVDLRSTLTPLLTPQRQISPQSVHSVTLEYRKTLKLPRVTEKSALCAARNAAGKHRTSSPPTVGVQSPSPTNQQLILW